MAVNKVVLRKGTAFLAISLVIAVLFVVILSFTLSSPENYLRDIDTLTRENRRLRARSDDSMLYKRELDQLRTQLSEKKKDQPLESKGKLSMSMSDYSYKGKVANLEKLALLGPDRDVLNVPKYTFAGKSRHKSLLAVPVGKKGLETGLVDKMVQKFGFEHFAIMLFHFDDADYTQYEWYDQCVHITVIGQMKWWFIKRFLTPQLVVSYEFIFIWDDDMDVELFDPIAYLDLVRKYQLHLSSPAQLPLNGEKTSIWNLMMQPENVDFNETPIRYTNFVECASPVASSKSWPCLWDVLQNDLSSGWGYDLAWYMLCNDILDRHAGIVDAVPVIHNSTKTASDSNNFKAQATKEQIALQKRFSFKYRKPKVLRTKAGKSEESFMRDSDQDEDEDEEGSEQVVVRVPVVKN